ncbi:MAG TPA: hypothetical protein VD963_00775 [Phycisphaerales bacterium]|nr:hypothetical protein [Phycisphaerales bacterium]
MSSSYKGLGLFNSGPHRFAVEPAGSKVIPVFVLDGASAGSVPLGPLELIVVVTGRLVAGTEAALWTLRDAILAQLTTPTSGGLLIDHHGRQFAEVHFTEFAPGDRTDRGRLVTLGYTARFIKYLAS